MADVSLLRGSRGVVRLVGALRRPLLAAQVRRALGAADELGEPVGDIRVTVVLGGASLPDLPPDAATHPVVLMPDADDLTRVGRLRLRARLLTGRTPVNLAILPTYAACGVVRRAGVTLPLASHEGSRDALARWVWRAHAFGHVIEGR
ncbi:hypothetical protein [Propioniciclava soli]|uniref:hypothetical protein n=1 Tax=Propioniciclava soli TaxID=2775081 RepID=UPI001E4FA58B|nr:hypothetical protein [Propioniciclava soli]